MRVHMVGLRCLVVNIYVQYDGNDVNCEWGEALRWMLISTFNQVEKKDKGS